MKYEEAIADLDAKLNEIEHVLDVGDVNMELFQELTKLYTNGLILKMQFQSSHTMRQRKEQYKKGQRDE